MTACHQRMTALSTCSQRNIKKGGNDMLKINGKIVTDVVYKGKRIERIYVGSKKYYDMYDGRISGYALGSGTLSINGNKYDYGAGYFDIHVGDTGNVSSIASLFQSTNMSSLSHIGLNTGRVLQMNHTFYNNSKLTVLDVSHFDTSKVQDMSLMFRDCSSLTSLDVSGFNTSHVTTMYSMFYGCSSLTSLDVSHFDTSKVQSMIDMFYDCRNMRTLNIGNMDLSGLTGNMNETFSDCSSLRSITGQFVGLKLSISFGSSPLLDHDSAMMVINSAETVTTVQTVSFSRQTKALLSDEEKAILTNKGWTLA